MAHNTSLSEGHSVISTPSNVEKRYSGPKSSNSSESSTTSFSDATIYAPDTSVAHSSEIMSETFLAKCSRSRHQNNTNASCRFDKPINSCNVTNQKPIDSIDKDHRSLIIDATCHQVVIENEGEEISNYSTSSKHNHHRVPSRSKKSKCTNRNNHPNVSNDCNRSCCSPNRTISASPTWKQKVKRIYL